MTLAIAILADKNLERTVQLAKFIAKAGINACIHIDASIPSRKFEGLRSALAEFETVIFTGRLNCEWGRFSLVQAELNMASDIIAKWPQTTHINLISGDSLPIRALDDLVAHLTSNPDTDFIESVTVGSKNWIVDGLEAERFTLRFPFSWKKQRVLFDLWVKAQRAFKLKRKIPSGITPHIGSQWWCLSRATIDAIIADPQKPEYDSYFRNSWIPDETYFQTLVRKHSSNINAHSLLYSRFDYQGKPTVFYDDHIDYLLNADAYFVRKIWPGANHLYNTLLSDTLKFPCPTLSDRRVIAEAHSRRTTGRNGLQMQSASTSPWCNKSSKTACRYQVFTGVQAVFPNFGRWYKAHTRNTPYGQLFAPDQAHFDDGACVGPGGLSCDANIRDFAPEAYLQNLAWHQRDAGLAFHFEANSLVAMEKYFTQDQNAQIHHIQYGWLLDLMGQNLSDQDALEKATYLAAREKTYLNKMHYKTTVAHTNLWTLGDAMGDPTPILSCLLTPTKNKAPSSPMLLPTRTSFEGLLDFALRLKDAGVDIDMDCLIPPPREAQRPKLTQAFR